MLTNFNTRALNTRDIFQFLVITHSQQLGFTRNLVDFFLKASRIFLDHPGPQKNSKKPNFRNRTFSRNRKILILGPRRPNPDLRIRSWVGFFVGGWGGESAAAPTGKSFRFVRACVRAGGRRARDQLRLPRGICMMIVPPPPRRPLPFQNGSVLAAVF